MAESVLTFAERVQRAIGDSERNLKEFRKARYEALREYVGSYWGGSGNLTTKALPLNLIYTTASVYVPNLVSREPAYRIRPRHDPLLRPYAYTAELALDHLVRQEIDLLKTLREVVYDSLFGVGIVKTAVGSGEELEFWGELYDVGQPYVARVSLDDYILDPACTDRRAARFEGHRFRVTREWAENNWKNTKGLPSHYPMYGSPRTSKVGKKYELVYEIDDMVEACEVYLPKEGVILTLPWESEGRKPLDEREYVGPEEGQYDILGYHYVLDCPLPLPPVNEWRDLHTLINVLLRKMKRQAERAKKIVAYKPGAVDDAERVQDSGDGDLVKFEKVDEGAVREIEFGGTRFDLSAFTMWLIQLFSRQAGNADLLGGIAAGARSATEAALVGGNAKIRVTDMQNQVYDLAKRLGKKLFWHLMDDPFVDKPLAKRIEGTNIIVPVRFNEQTRKGKFIDYNFDVVPYSMRPEDPDAYAQRLVEWWGAVALPTIQLAMQQGTHFDIAKMARLIAREMGINQADVDDVYKEIVPGPGSMPGAPQPFQPPGQSKSPGGAMMSGAQPGQADKYVAQVFGQAQQGAPKPQAQEPLRAVKMGR